MQFRYCNLISRLAREDEEFHAVLARGTPPWTVWVSGFGVELD
jgi:hypothetical protein